MLHVTASTAAVLIQLYGYIVIANFLKGGGCSLSWPLLSTIRSGKGAAALKIAKNDIYSAPEPKAQVHYCDHALSVVRPSLTFHIFDFSSDTTEQNSTKLDRKQELNILYRVCVFRTDQKNKMAALTSDWLRHFRLLLWNRWTEFNETWREARSQCPLPSLCFLGRSEKQDGRPDLWLAETFSTSPLKSLNGIQPNLTGNKISTSSTKFVFFGPIGKTRWPPWPLIGWDIFDFSSETAEQNSTKLDGKQDLNVPYQVCVFWTDRKNKMAALTSDWLRHFRLLLWNSWTEFNETWREARSQCPPTKFVFFVPIGKTRWPPWHLIGWDIFDFSSETAEQNSTKLDTKQDLNVLYQACVFFADWKNKMAALASDWLRHFRLLLWNRWTEFNQTWQEARTQHPLQRLCFSGRFEKKAVLASDWMRHFRLLLWKGWTEFNETWREARSQRPLPSLCFSGRSEKQDGSGLWLDETFSTSLLKRLNGIQRNLTGSKISTSSTEFVFFALIGKTRWPPWPLIGWDIFDFSSETAERNSMNLDRKQDLNVLYQVCVFRADQ